MSRSMVSCRPLLSIVAAFVLFVLLALPACKFGPTTSDRSVQLIDLAEFDRLVGDPKTRTFVVDPRPARRYQQAHLPGAISLPIDQLGSETPELAEAQRIIVYADGPRDFLSTAAAKKLLALGYSNVYDFRGGIELWQAEDRELVQEPTPDQ